MLFSSKTIRWSVAASLVLLPIASNVQTAHAAGSKSSFVNALERRDLIANRADLPGLIGQPLIDPNLVNPWGAAIRPAGAGGHFWFANAGANNVTTYVGDSLVGGVFKPIFQDALKIVPTDGPPIGQVFNGVVSEFPVEDAACSDDSSDGCTTDSPSYIGQLNTGSKFIVATEDGKIEGWAEGTVNGVFGRFRRFVPVVNNPGAIYRGVTITQSPSDNWLLAANFASGAVEAYDSNWNRIYSYTIKKKHYIPFLMPKQIPSYYRPFNVWCSGDKVFVTYARLVGPLSPEFDPEDPIAESGLPGTGYVVMFDRYGQKATLFEGQKKLAAPWGMAIAPSSWGAFSGQLLVGNFATGRIVAMNLKTHKQGDYLRDQQKAPLSVDGLWALFFGNGASLGQSDHLYFSAGPNGETDGVVGTLAQPSTTPTPIPTNGKSSANRS